MNTHKGDVTIQVFPSSFSCLLNQGFKSTQGFHTLRCYLKGLVHFQREPTPKNKRSSRQKTRKWLKTKKANFKRRVCMTKPRVPRRTNKKING